MTRPRQRHRALPPATDNLATHMAPADADAELDVLRRIEMVRAFAAKTEAFATIADEQLEEVRGDQRRRERFAFLVTEVSIAAQDTLREIETLAADLACQRRP